MSVTREQVETAIRGYVDPYLDEDLVTAKCLQDVRVDGDRVAVDLQLGFPCDGYRDRLAGEISSRVEALEGVATAAVKVGFKVVTHEVQKGLKPLKNVSNVIAVASGKGGVGVDELEQLVDHRAQLNDALCISVFRRVNASGSEPTIACGEHSERELSSGGGESEPTTLSRKRPGCFG